MNLFNLFLTSLIAMASLVNGDVQGFQEGLNAQGDQSGWYPVEPIEKQVFDDEAGDPSIWALFTKHTDAGDIWVRFPAEPHYEYAQDGSLVVTAVSEGEVYQMTVQALGEADQNSTDRLYSSEGKWVNEHHLQSNGHRIVLKVVGDHIDSHQIKTFFSSFSIGKNR